MNHIYLPILVAIVRGIGALSLFLFTLAVTRNISPYQSGIFFHVHSIVMILSPLCLCGANHLSVKYLAIAISKGDGKIIRGFAFGALVLVACASFVVSIFLGMVNFLWGEFNPYIALKFPLILIPMVIFTSLTLLVSYIMQGLGRPLSAALYQSALPLMFSIISIYFIDTFGILNSSVVLYIYCASYFAALVLGLATVFQILGVGAVEFPKLVKHKKPLTQVWIISFLTSLLNWSPLFLLGFLAIPSEVANFAVAQRISMSLAILLIAINMVISPRIAVLHSKGDSKKLVQLMRNTVNLLFIIMIPISTGIIYFREDILSLFGTDYSKSGAYLLVLLCGQFINSVTGPCSQFMIMIGEESQLLRNTLTSVFVCILLSLILVSIFGGIGAAIGLSVGIALQNILSSIQVVKNLRCNIFSLLSH